MQESDVLGQGLIEFNESRQPFKFRRERRRHVGDNETVLI